MSSFIERLARRVVHLETKVNRALTSPQLGSSSIEDGTMEEYDENGQLVSIIGKQPDGTHGAVVVSGPVPPRPAAPQASGGPGLLNYAWGGVFANAATGSPEETIPAPMDFARIEVHASKTSGFSAVTADTLIGTIESPRGSSNSVVAESGTWYVVLVTRALSGKASMQSLETSAVVQAAPDVEGLLDEFNQEADRLQQELNANAGELAAAQGRLDTLTTRTGTVESSLATVQSQVNTKNKVVNSTGNASGTTGYVAGDTWQKWTTLADGGKLVAAWRFTVDNTWLPVILDPTYLPQVDIGQGTFGTLSGSRLDANSVTADVVNAQSVGAAVGAFVEADIGKLRVIGDSNLNTLTADRIFSNLFSTRKLFANQIVVGQAGNLVANGYGELGDSSNFPAPWGRNASDANAKTLAGADASFWLLGRVNGLTETTFPLVPGSEYKVSVYARGNVTGKRFYVQINTNGPTSPYAISNAQTGTAYTKFDGSFTAPAGATWGRLNVYANHANGTTTDGHQWFAGFDVREKITPAVIVDGFFQGLRVIGASIETNAAANTGIKLTDAGLVGHGVANDYDPVGQINIGYNTKASIDIRQPAWTAFPSDRVPGLWFDSAKQGAAGATPPAVPAAVTASNAPAQGVRIQSSQQISALDYRSSLVVDQNLVTMTAQSDRTSTSAPPREQAVATVGSTGFSFTADRSDGQRSVLVQGYTNDGVLRLSGTNITANGESLTNITRARLTLTNGYTHWTNSGWNGLWYERLGRMVIITGAVGNSSAWSAGSLIANVPTALRPANKAQGINCELQADGRLQMGNPGSAASAMSITYFLP